MIDVRVSSTSLMIVIASNIMPVCVAFKSWERFTND